MAGPRECGSGGEQECCPDGVAEERPSPGCVEEVRSSEGAGERPDESARECRSGGAECRARGCVQQCRSGDGAAGLRSQAALGREAGGCLLDGAPREGCRSGGCAQDCRPAGVAEGCRSDRSVQERRPDETEGFESGECVEEARPCARDDKRPFDRVVAGRPDASASDCPSGGTRQPQPEGGTEKDRPGDGAQGQATEEGRRPGEVAKGDRSGEGVRRRWSDGVVEAGHPDGSVPEGRSGGVERPRSPVAAKCRSGGCVQGCRSGKCAPGCRTEGRVAGGSGAMRSAARLRCTAEPDLEAVLSAKEFAQWVVRLVLEVLDHRRLVTHMTSVADARIVAALRTMVNADVVPGRGLGVAVPQRVTIRMVDARTAEICAGYDRGARHFALAARITRIRGQWRLSALRLR